MNEQGMIRENYVGSVIFGILAFGGIFGVCAGNLIHLFTIIASGSVSWALWHEAKQIKSKPVQGSRAADRAARGNAYEAAHGSAAVG